MNIKKRRKKVLLQPVPLNRQIYWSNTTPSTLHLWPHTHMQTCSHIQTKIQTRIYTHIGHTQLLQPARPTKYNIHAMDLIFNKD